MSVSDPQSSFDAMLQQFGKYKLLGHLATGGMAEVWLARQVGIQGFEKIVVIKRARPELTDHASTTMFLDEARLVATLEHPNIAQVYEIGIANGSYFFVMEYVDGADLRRLMEAASTKHVAVSLGDALYIMTHVCAALHYAHEKHDLDGRDLHIIHRDVSPSNVLISHDGAIKVCDFGIAKAHSRRANATDGGVLKGKYQYMSPEQCRGQTIDRRSDVFSIGILLYELTTMSRLFGARGDYAVIKQLLDEPIPPPSTVVDGYPRELEEIVMKALARAPERRYATAQALQLDLEAFAREHRLGLSSVGIARLMRALFEKDTSAWIRARRGHDDYDVEVSDPNNRAAFLAIGSAQTGALSPSEATPIPTTATVHVGARPGAALWLLGAVLAGAVAGAVAIVDQRVTAADAREVARGLATGAEQLTAAIEAVAQSAHLRGDGIATSPVLRAAIGTDAATLDDLARTEMVFTTEKGDVLEVFQIRDGRTDSLIRLPAAAKPLQPLDGRATRIRVAGDRLVLYASTPVAGYQGGVRGSLVIATAVDLAPVRRALSEYAIHASVMNLGDELVLVDRPGEGAAAIASPTSGGARSTAEGGAESIASPTSGGARSTAEGGAESINLALPSSGDPSGRAILRATPVAAAGLAWAADVRNISAGLAGLLLIGFVVALVRARRAAT